MAQGRCVGWLVGVIDSRGDGEGDIGWCRQANVFAWCASEAARAFIN